MGTAAHPDQILATDVPVMEGLGLVAEQCPVTQVWLQSGYKALDSRPGLGGGVAGWTTISKDKAALSTPRWIQMPP